MLPFQHKAGSFRTERKLMVKKADKKKKREKESRQKILRRRAETRKRAKEEKIERAREAREIRFDYQVGMAKRANSPRASEIPTGKNLPGPNKPCFCNSGKKFKRCCSWKIKEERAAAREERRKKWEEAKAEAKIASASSHSESTGVAEITPRVQGTATTAEPQTGLKGAELLADV